MNTKKYIIEDWAGNRIMPSKDFVSFEEGWDYILGELTNRLALTDEDYQEYYVLPNDDEGGRA